ncbi:hypothetical protein VTK73DRAFT_6330 [Phialemonium thermophilum]|uniref:Uncharacterized protein n=1 Tax=Phialemonium thermophilum TaxID=223376 RepID=A0ABR3V1D6_9PEZI
MLAPTVSVMPANDAVTSWHWFRLPTVMVLTLCAVVQQACENRLSVTVLSDGLLGWSLGVQLLPLLPLPLPSSPSPPSPCVTMKLWNVCPPLLEHASAFDSEYDWATLPPQSRPVNTWMWLPRPNRFWPTPCVRPRNGASALWHTPRLPILMVSTRPAQQSAAEKRLSVTVLSDAIEGCAGLLQLGGDGGSSGCDCVILKLPQGWRPVSGQHTGAFWSAKTSKLSEPQLSSS